jgi:hypothetical protein
VEALHLMSMQVHETCEGNKVRAVEIFKVKHPEAIYAYAWTYEDHNHGVHDVAISGVPTVSSAQDAVRAYCVQPGESRLR